MWSSREEKEFKPESWDVPEKPPWSLELSQVASSIFGLQIPSVCCSFYQSPLEYEFFLIFIIYLLIFWCVFVVIGDLPWPKW